MWGENLICSWFLMLKWIIHDKIKVKDYKKEEIKMHYTYILKCKDGTYYTGYTNHLEKRVQAHNDGKGAKYTKGRRPVEVVYFEIHEDKHIAMRREWEIKQMTREEKSALIRSQIVNKEKSTYEES